MPIHPELASVLRAEKSRRSPADSDTVLLNPLTGQAYDTKGKSLYRRMMAIGERLGIEETRPHRFRCTFAVDALLKGAQPIEIARLLGDKLETVVKSYLPLSEAMSKSTRELLARQDRGIEATQDAPAVISMDRKERVA
jgi:integrase